ncbi:MAG: Gfo/Idh/MocA family oxidoreductase [bacterium]
MPESHTMNRRKFTTTIAAAALTAASARRVLGANDRIGVGVIGCGGRGGAHMDTLAKLKENGTNVTITAVCDIYRPRLDKAKERTGAGRSTMKHEELLSWDDVDVVLASGPDHAHGYHALDAMLAGKDVYCEKPLCHWSQLELPQRLVQVSRETGQLVQVGTQWMVIKAYHQARELIQNGAIGKPLMAETGYYRVGDWGERGMRIDDPNAKPGPDLDWERFLSDCPRRQFDVSRFFRWRMYWDYAGGPPTDLYPHPYTPLAYMLDLGYPDSVVSTGGKHRYSEREVPDTCNMIIEYPDDFTAILTGTQGNDFTNLGTDQRPIIRGWDATMTFEKVGDQDEIVIRPTQDSPVKEQHIPTEIRTREWIFWGEFLECCRNRKQPAANIELGAKVQTVMQMGLLALRGERVVRFDHDRECVVD